jgi:hypothetical protein
MKLPEFDSAGNLPVGVHNASWSEFKDRYGYNPARAAILAQIELWLAHMKQAGCRAVYIDGSFVCSKAEPGDYDACWDHTGMDPKRVDPCLLDQSPNGRLVIKQRYGGDLRPDRANPPGSIMTYVRFFQRDGRLDGRPKGIVIIKLQEAFP